jgi:outer membrane receptor protein involved in Fe transport
MTQRATLSRQMPSRHPANQDSRTIRALRAIPFLLVAASAALALTAGAAHAQTTGTIAGLVSNQKTGKPMSFANVLVTGTVLGANTKDDGSFVIRAVPPGEHDLLVSYMGFDAEHRTVLVLAGDTVRVEVRLRETVVREEKEVLVVAERPLVDVKRASTTRSFNADELKTMTLQPTLESVVEQQPGVTKDNNKIHIRGGRAEETLFIIDGVQMRDLISGDSKGTGVSARSMAEVNIITGGFDAKYGQALSGVVDAKTKDGGERYEGYIGYQTDRLFGDEQQDFYEFELGGPLGILHPLLKPIGGRGQERPTFYLSVGVELNNSYLPAIDDLPDNRHLRSDYRESILGATRRYGEFFYPRANNDWRVGFKTTWKASAVDKFTLGLNKSISFDEGFGDTDVAAVNRNVVNYAWGWRNTFDHYYTSTNDQNSFSFTWNRSLGTSLSHQLKLTRYFSANHKDVAGKRWDQYAIGDSAVTQRPDTDPYFRIAAEGDAPSYTDRWTKTWSMDSDWIRKWKRHDMRWGLHSQYEVVQYLSLDATTVSQARPLGKEFDLFKVTPNTGALYLQDRMEYEGLVAGVGVRYDYWFPGEQVEQIYKERTSIIASDETAAEWLHDTHPLFGHRFKGHLSPRIEVSHPITEKDNLFFNYGHFTQRPPYFYVYAKSGSQSAEEFPRIGNPNLNPEISVQYELGAGHTFHRDMAFKVSMFYKDIYDYPTSATITLAEHTGSRSSYFVYFNRDYARSRGVELELKKNKAGSRISWNASYTYALVKGKSSDPNNLALVRATGGDARETNLDEEYMWWNRPHKLTVWWDYKVAVGDRTARLAGVHLPQDLSLNLYYLIMSGRAYTPQDIYGQDTGPAYSRTGPIETAINGTIRQGFRFVGHRWEVTLQGWNLTDHRTVLTIDPVSGERYQMGKGSLWNAYTRNSYETTAEYDRRIAYATTRYADPSMRSAPRNVRLGLGVTL